MKHEHARPARGRLAAFPIGLIVVLCAAFAMSGAAAFAGEPAAQEIFQKRTCPVCHKIPGVPGATIGVLGPDLAGFGSKRRFLGDELLNTPENLRRWLHDPKSVKAVTMMPNLNLTDEELDTLIKYIEGL